MLLRAINDQFSVIYWYYCCHKHLLRNTIKIQLDSPDHCTDVNPFLCFTYFFFIPCVLRIHKFYTLRHQL